MEVERFSMGMTQTGMGRDITDCLFKKIGGLSDELLMRFEPRDLAALLTNYVSKWYEESPESANAWLADPFCVDILNSLGVSPEAIGRLAEASIVVTYDLEDRVRLAAKTLMNKLLADQKPEGCWNYRRLETGERTTNAWVTATCLYALWKTSSFLDLGSENFGNKISVAKEKAIEWLWSSLRTLAGQVGWSDSCEDECPKLYDSAYVLNILLRIQPDAERPYESVLNTLKSWLTEGHGCWRLEDGSNIDVPGTCYGLRLFGTYVRFAEKRPPERQISGSDLDALSKLRDKICVALVKRQKNEGYWPGQGRCSDQATTALAIGALRSAGRSRDWQAISDACRWLLERFTYYKGNWCWTRRDSKTNALEESVYDSALCLSALVKGTTFERFSRAEAAILWLTKKLVRKDFYDDVDLPPVLCTFTDYLKCFKEPGFLDSSAGLSEESERIYCLPGQIGTAL